ncbi:MAG TPA: ELWxxDGT repeat protein [Thermoanaerobaculia bacterium]
MKLSAVVPVLLAAVLVPLPGHARTASLVRDINTRITSGTSSSPYQVTPFRDKVVFEATEASSGGEIWVSDGTESGTEMLRDVCPESCSSVPLILGTTSRLVFWASSSEGEGSETGTIWRSDGTRQGTFPLSPQVAFHQRVLHEEYAFLGDLLLFEGCDAIEGCGLWRTDGTSEGTVLLQEFPRPFEPQPYALTAAGNQIFYLLDSPENVALWRTDGTTAGTVQLKVFESGDPEEITVAGGRIFFLWYSASRKQELWTSDGTRAGTQALARFEPFEVLGSNRKIHAFANRVYWLVNDRIHGQEIWRSDGTPQGTRRITELAFAEPFGHSPSFPLAAEAGSRLVFTVTDGTAFRLWSTDGNPASTSLIHSLCPGGCQSLPSDLWSLVSLGTRALFLAEDAARGRELWSTDGTAAGTRIIRDLCPGPCSLEIERLQPLPGAFAFVAEESGKPLQLWRTDGTVAGTHPLTSFTRETSAVYTLTRIIAAGQKIFFIGANRYGEELWVIDARQVRMVADIGRPESSSEPKDLVPFGDTLFFTATGGVFQSSGTFETTFTIRGDSSIPTIPWIAATALGRLFFAQGRDLCSALSATGAVVRLTSLQNGSIGSLPVELNGRAYFKVVPFSGAPELWQTDGTPQGTSKVATLPLSSRFYGPVSVGSQLYLSGVDATGAHTIWVSDGTAAGTRKILDIPNEQQFQEEWSFRRAGGSVFFATYGPYRSVSYLWRTDGTNEGTYRLDESTGFEALGDSTEYMGQLYFLADGGDWGIGLWTSNGTAAGTLLFKEAILPRARLRELPKPGHIAVFAGRLFFAASILGEGVELWSSDGTVAGTTLVRDIFPGPHSSKPAWLTVASDRLFFAANDGVHGVELWETDGTTAGTRMVQDIASLASSSYPERLTAAGDRLYFTADDRLVGRELWVLPLAGLAGCQSSPTRLCLSGGRYQVEAFWRDFQGHAGRGQAVSLTPDTGYFWFFDDSNVETVVKVLNGTGTNGHVWVFYGALSNVEYTLKVTDTQTGLTRHYFNPLRQFASVGDTHGFGPLGAYSSSPAPSTAAPSLLPLVAERTDPAAATGVCQAGAERLCLNGNRFAVEVSWRDFQNRTGKGKAVGLTADTGYFWFFNDANVELVTKVLDGTDLNGKYWFFYGALSNVEYMVTVTDTQTGRIKTYRNPRGRFASVGDTQAF